MKSFYTVSKVIENVYRITSAENVFCELLVGSQYAMLIDTGFGLGDLSATVRGITDRPLIIVNTHGHLDHTCGNAQFPESIYISEKDIPLCKVHNSLNYRKRTMDGLNAVDETGEHSIILPDNFDVSKYISDGCGNLVPLYDDMVFNLGGVTVKAVATPGHTSGCVSFLYEEENWMYVGDQANGYCWLFLEESLSRETHIMSLDRIIDLQPSKVFGSHMPEPVEVGNVLLYKRAAEEADYAKGFPFTSEIIEANNVRVCPIDGMTIEDFNNPGFASVVIGAGF